MTRPEAIEHALPVLVAAHGAGDNAELMCDFWTPVVRGRAFVLCPRGTAMDSRAPENSSHFFRNHHALEKEVLGGLAALTEAFEKSVAAGPVIYAAYSQGATMGALVARDRPALFSRLILVEGGGGEWNRAIARNYRSAGGEKVLFACGTRDCAQKAERSEALLTRAQIAARTTYVPGGGHTYAGSVGEQLKAHFEWVIEGDERWRQ